VATRFELFLVDESQGEKKITEKPFAGRRSFHHTPPQPLSDATSLLTVTRYFQHV
jgi:hypothetical protein